MRWVQKLFIENVFNLMRGDVTRCDNGIYVFAFTWSFLVNASKNIRRSDH